MLHYLGVMPAMLMNMPAMDNDLNDQINFAMGAGVEPDLHQRFEKRFGFPLIEGWAMTETGAGACFMTDREPRHVGKRCMGKAGDEMEFRIVDDDENDVAENAQGELLVRRKGDNPAYGFFSEYYKNQKATDEVWLNGWFHTGDVVRKDKDEFVFFIERKKNIIRRSGENIAAAEVESVLIDHPAIANCAIAPLPDPVREEEVAACVVLNNDYPADEETAKKLVNYCLGRLSYYKVPAYIIFVDRLPVTSTQKVQRGELRALCLKLSNSSQCIDCRYLKKKNQN
jgi:acyl-coenzyme A synthetase/AMP-(fatty) acid ligase